jgi:hypothetical protein
MDLEGLRRDAEDRAGLLRAAGQAVGGCAGQDRHGAVRVTLDQCGRVIDLALAVDWRSRVGTDGLSGAVVEAAGDAGRRSLERWAVAVAQSGTPPEPIALATPSAGDPADPAAVESARQLHQLLLEVDDRIDDLVRRRAESADQAVVGRSSNGHVVVTIRGGALSGVDCNRRWLAAARRLSIVASLREAVRAGYEAARLLSDESAAVGPMTELRESTGDFGALLSRLGLGTGSREGGNPDGTE